MQSTITDQFFEKQAHINQRRDEAISRYPELWSKVTAEWNSSHLNEFGRDADDLWDE